MAVFEVGQPVSALVGTEEGMDLSRGTVARVLPIENGHQLVLVKLVSGGEVQFGSHTGYIVHEPAGVSS